MVATAAASRPSSSNPIHMHLRLDFLLLTLPELRPCAPLERREKRKEIESVDDMWDLFFIDVNTNSNQINLPHHRNPPFRLSENLIDQVNLPHHRNLPSKLSEDLINLVLQVKGLIKAMFGSLLFMHIPFKLLNNFFFTKSFYMKLLKKDHINSFFLKKYN